MIDFPVDHEFLELGAYPSWILVSEWLSPVPAMGDFGDGRVRERKVHSQEGTEKFWTVVPQGGGESREALQRLLWRNSENKTK